MPAYAQASNDQKARGRKVTHGHRGTITANDSLKMDNGFLERLTRLLMCRFWHSPNVWYM